MSTSNNSPVRALVRASWEATVGERLRFSAFMICFVLSYTLELIMPWAIGFAIDAFVKHGLSDKAYEQARLCLLAYIGLKLANIVFHHYGRFLQNTVTYSAHMYTLNKVFSALLKFPLNWHIEHHSGDNLSKLHRAVGAIDSCIGTYVWQVVDGTVKVIFASVAIFALDFWVAINVLAMGVVTILIMILFNSRLRDCYRENNVFGNKISRICVDYLFNVVTVKTLGLEKPAQRYLSNQKNEGLKYSRKISKFGELKWGTTSVGYGLVIGSSLLIYFYRIKSQNIPFDVATVYVLQNYLDKIFQAIGSFTAYYGGIIEAATSYEDGASILAHAAGIGDKPDQKNLSPSWKRISIRDLHFAYRNSEVSRLRGMALDIDRTDKIALVGPSGGGKSTLLKIIGGLLIPEKVEVSTDAQSKIDISDVGATSLLVPQEPEIFSETFRFNLTMGEPFSEEELRYFIKLGKVEGILNKLPKGHETDLAEKGLNLSVGEKQRVAMVRGLLRARDRNIILLDEPTSSLDPKTEKEIFMSLLSHFKDRVIITACHRLNLVPLFDKVVFIRDGRVEETGSFTELLERGGPFARAWEDYIKKIPREGIDTSEEPDFTF